MTKNNIITQEILIDWTSRIIASAIVGIIGGFSVMGLFFITILYGLPLVFNYIYQAQLLNIFNWTPIFTRLSLVFSGFMFLYFFSITNTQSKSEAKRK